MKMIVGLGNPGKEYENTRHNMGFIVLDNFAKSLGISIDKNKFNALYKDLFVAGEKVLLVKPLSYMNLSGEAIRAVMDYYKIDVKDIIIIYDDIALNIGKIRIRANGSDGGHNGIKSIISHIGTNNFNRIKIGIGPQIGPSEYFVLNNFPKEQSEILKEVLDKSIDAAKSIMLDGIEKTQNKFN